MADSISFMDDPANPERLHGTNYNAADMHGSFARSREQETLQRWAMQNNPITQSLQSAILRLINTTQGQAFGPNAGYRDMIPGHVSSMLAAQVGNAFSSPGQMMWGLQSAIANGNMRMSGPDGMMFSGGRGFQNRVAQDFFQSYMQERPFGSNGFKNSRIGEQLLPSLTQRGVFAGMDVSLGGDGQLTDGTKRSMKGVIDESTKMLREVGEVFGTDDIAVLMSEAERITGLVASNRANVGRMKDRLTSLRDTATVLGMNPAALMKFTEASGLSMAQNFMEAGMSPEQANRTGKFLAGNFVRQSGMAKAEYDLQRADALKRGIMLPEKEMPEFQKNLEAQFGASLSEVGSAEFIAAQLQLQNNQNLTPEQRKSLQGAIDTYADASNKQEWAASARSRLNESGVGSLSEFFRYHNFSDLSEAGQTEFGDKFFSGSKAADAKVTNIMNRARSMGGLKKNGKYIGKDREKNLSNTLAALLSSFDPETRNRVVAALQESPEAAAALISGGGLEKFLPAGMTAEDFATGASADADLLKNINAQDFGEGTTASRQSQSQFKQKEQAMRLERAIYANDSAKLPSFGENFLAGFMQYVDPSDAKVIDAAISKGGGDLLRTKISKNGGIELDKETAKKLIATFSNSGADAYKALGLKPDAGIEDFIMRASTSEGLTGLLKEGEGKTLTQLGITQLQELMTKSGITADAEGGLKFKDAAAHMDFMTKAGLLNDRELGDLPKEISKDSLAQPGGVGRLRDAVLKTKRGKKMLDDGSVIWGDGSLREDWQRNANGEAFEWFNDASNTPASRTAASLPLVKDRGADEARKRAESGASTPRTLHVATMIVSSVQRSGAGAAI